MGAGFWEENEEMSDSSDFEKIQFRTIYYRLVMPEDWWVSYFELEGYVIYPKWVEV